MDFSTEIHFLLRIVCMIRSRSLHMDDNTLLYIVKIKLPALGACAVIIRTS